MIYLDIKIPHLQVAHQGGNLAAGNIKIHLLLTLSLWDFVDHDQIQDKHQYCESLDTNCICFGILHSSQFIFIFALWCGHAEVKVATWFWLQQPVAYLIVLYRCINVFVSSCLFVFVFSRWRDKSDGGMQQKQENMNGEPLQPLSAKNNNNTGFRTPPSPS